ncbi:hypothetical protein FHX42_003599 [Saccharopolyspora lacisalsi]|uniref:A-factor biosynthesis hotdog domain-containing protein n=1 Tax=Halosaccharopolyspora lacisalsi TaxID=1000566 RepID=A0A839DYZ6_9PSEU|nr:AfsA-related hotdog domain-containing protein [Halosaccharopolyspora lacisalsi]MBA8826223.1 hypothetical protein [Halosaccharopolyspora lacisalsi]
MIVLSEHETGTTAFDELHERLSFDRTVDRTLLHRAALSEVFVTDSCRTGDSTYAVAAQLPASHAFYTSLLISPRTVDPLLLECCRQAETLCTHEYFGVDRCTKFVLREWSLEVDPDVISGLGTPAELIVEVEPHSARYRDGRLLGTDYEMRMRVESGTVGLVRMAVNYLPPEPYAVMRRRGRPGPPPSSDEFAAGTAAQLVPPYWVGRTNPADVLLCEPVVTVDSVTAGVRVPVDNASMFDHAQDHLPGMILMEAARQVVAFTMHEHHGISPARGVVAGMDARFFRYAELDAPLSVVAKTGDRGGCAVSFLQNGDEVAAVDTTPTVLPQRSFRTGQVW